MRISLGVDARNGRREIDPENVREIFRAVRASEQSPAPEVAVNHVQRTRKRRERGEKYETRTRSRRSPLEFACATRPGPTRAIAIHDDTRTRTLVSALSTDTSCTLLLTTADGNDTTPSLRNLPEVRSVTATLYNMRTHSIRAENISPSSSRAENAEKKKHVWFQRTSTFYGVSR